MDFPHCSQDRFHRSTSREAIAKTRTGDTRVIFDVVKERLVVQGMSSKSDFKKKIIDLRERNLRAFVSENSHFKVSVSLYFLGSRKRFTLHFEKRTTCWKLWYMLKHYCFFRMDIKKYYSIDSKRCIGNHDYKIYQAESMSEKQPVSVHAIKKVDHTVETLTKHGAEIRFLSDQKYFPHILEIFESDSSFLVVTDVMKPCLLAEQIRLWGPLSKADWETVAEAVISTLWKFSREFPKLVRRLTIEDIFVIPHEMGEFGCYFSPRIVIEEDIAADGLSTLFDTLSTLFREMRIGRKEEEEESNSSNFLSPLPEKKDLDDKERQVIRKLKMWHPEEESESDLQDFFNTLWSGLVRMGPAGIRSPNRSRGTIIRLKGHHQRAKTPDLMREASNVTDAFASSYGTANMLGLEEGTLVAIHASSDEGEEDEEWKIKANSLEVPGLGKPISLMDSPNHLPTPAFHHSISSLSLSEMATPFEFRKNSAFSRIEDFNSGDSATSSDSQGFIEEENQETPREAFVSKTNPKRLLLGHSD